MMSVCVCSKNMWLDNVQLEGLCLIFDVESRLLLACLFGLNLCPRIVAIDRLIEPRHEISNNVVCATSKGLDQPAHMCSLIRAFASPLNVL